MPSSATSTTFSTVAPTPSTDLDVSADLPTGSAAKQPDTRLVSDVLAEPAGGHGWPLAAGSWIADTFDPAVSVDLGDDVIVTRQSPNATHFALPGSDGRTTITMLVPSAVLSPTGPVAMPDDLVTFAESLPNVDVTDVGEIVADDGRVINDIALRIEPPDGTSAIPCSIGPRCVAVFLTEASEFVNVRAGEEVRVFTTESDGIPVVVVAQGSDSAQLATAARIGAGLIATARLVDDPPARHGASFLASAGVRADHIPAGRYLAHLGSAVLDLDLAEDVASTRLQLVEPRAIVLVVARLGSIALLRPDGFIDPRLELPPAGPGPFDRTLANGPGTASEFEDWLSQLATVTATGSTEIGDRPASWWDVAVDPLLPSEPCGPRSTTGDGRCIDLIASDVVRYLSDRNANRLHWVGEADLVVHLTSADPDGLDELLRTAEPILDAIEVRPTG